MEARGGPAVHLSANQTLKTSRVVFRRDGSGNAARDARAALEKGNKTRTIFVCFKGC